MAVDYPGTARYLSPGDSARFLPTTPPVLHGYSVDASRAFARLWTQQGRLLWVREMTRDAVGSDYFSYTMVVGTTNEKKRFTFSAGVTGGPFQFRYNDVATQPIQWINNATILAERVKNALVAHVDFSDSSNLLVTYNTTTRQLDIEFINGRGKLNIGDMYTINNLTGTTPTITGSLVAAGNGDVPARNSGAGHYSWDMIGINDTTGRFSGNISTMRLARSSGLEDFWLDTVPTVTLPAGTNRVVAGSTVVVNITQVPFVWVVSSLLDIEYQSIDVVDDVTNEQIDITDGPGNAWSTTDGELRQYTLPYQRVVNGRTYRWSLRVRSVSGAERFLTGKFTVTFTPPATLTSATLTFAGNNAYATVAYPKSVDAGFLDYVFRVRRQGVSFGSRKNFVLARITDINQLSYATFEFPFNTPLVFSIVQRALRSGIPIESAPKEFTVTKVPYDGIIINNLTFPRTTIEFPAHEGRSIRGTKDNSYIQAWGGEKPIGLGRKGAAYEVRFSASLMGSYPDGIREQWEAIKAYYENTESDTFLYRDALGEMVYGILDAPTLNVDKYSNGAPTIEVQITETRYIAPTLEVT